ncbi:hypothetical protein N8376_00135 [Flavobacteriaceae bacterium]|nr:hypothetical protein [Flavobacteriaceae bacterium]MDC1491752.1 hypothetical protein [Flavobacteriaceae bacterium]
MKKLFKIPALLFTIMLIVSSCGKDTKSDVDVCKCLTEPGNSKYMQENNDSCRDVISKEIGVKNWEKVNMSLSENSGTSAKFDALAKRCQ